MKTQKFLLTEQEMPRQWYNIMADLPTPMEPPLHPGTGQPCGPEDLAPIFPMNLIEQEVSTQRWIDIPEEILDKYAIWRPSPLYRARNLEKALDTPARIYFKNEGVSPAGSHKPNTALAQAYYNKVAALKRSPRRPGPGSGAAAWPCAVRFSALSARCSW
jgi:tryptophan synthase beta chain